MLYCHKCIYVCVAFKGLIYRNTLLFHKCIFLSPEQLKLGLTTETKAWRLHYGKACNNKYRTEMEDIFEFIDDLGKRLGRQVKDLDDIRHAMKALKEIRENEIRIDMAIGPIEVMNLIMLSCSSIKSY